MEHGINFNFNCIHIFYMEETLKAYSASKLLSFDIIFELFLRHHY